MNKKRGKRPMTPKMLRLLQYLKNYSTKHGYMPTFLEMANEMGYKSKNSISAKLNWHT